MHMEGLDKEGDSIVEEQEANTMTSGCRNIIMGGGGWWEVKKVVPL
jgi:hypothetical protein